MINFRRSISFPCFKKKHSSQYKLIQIMNSLDVLCKKFGFKKIIRYSTLQKTFRNGTRVTIEKPVDFYVSKCYKDDWIKRKVLVEENEYGWNVELTLETIDGMESEEFECEADADVLLDYLRQYSANCCQITQL